MTDIRTIPKTSDEDGLTLRVEQGLALLRMANELDQVRNIKVQAFAYRALMRELGASKLARRNAEMLIVRAERRMGEFTAEMEKVPNDGTRNSESVSESKCDGKLNQLAAHNITPKEASEYEQLANIPEVELQEHETALADEGKPITRGRILKRHKEPSGRKAVASRHLQTTLASLRSLDEHELAIVANAIAKTLSGSPRLEVVQ